MSLDNQRVLLVGAATGIGLSTLEHLLSAGARVIVADKQIDLLKKNTQSLAQRYPMQFDCCWLDLSDQSRLVEMLDSWQQQAAFDHLVCCAGVLHVGALHELPIDVVKQTFEINTFGVLVLMQTLAKGMKSHGSGSMVIVGSNAANTPRNAIGAYGASKAALHMMVITARFQSS
nr:SDR family NAD(P)-dependent oxidoreductase [uncultured Vibrio sp.]